MASLSHFELLILLEKIIHVIMKTSNTKIFIEENKVWCSEFLKAHSKV